MTKFDPNAAASRDSGVFGLPFSEKESALVYFPIPWEATTSYGGGTSNGPAAILEASKQVDLYDLEVLRPYEPGLHMLKENKQIRAWNKEAKKAAQSIIAFGGDLDAAPKAKRPALKKALARVNALSAKVNDAVHRETLRLLNAGKIPGLVGGDHAVPLGAFRAVGEKFGDFGILHFDAHSDTRIAYEGFQYSHASIMHNALEEVPQIKKLVQVGIRDFCEQEVDYCRAQGDRVSIFFDQKLAQRKYAGETWQKIADEIIEKLPKKVWISFDIDGLDPRFCPHTGTPVPGGLEFNEAVYIVRRLAESGRTIIGFDLNEVAPSSDKDDEWDANVGARLLYKLTAWTLVSQGKCKKNQTEQLSP